MLPGPIDQRIFIDPTDAGGIRPQCGSDAIGQASTYVVEVLKDARSGPIQVGTVFEDDVDEGKTEEREATYVRRIRYREHRRCQRIRDLILHDLRCLAGILGKYNNLYIGQVGYCVERCRSEGPYSGRNYE